MKDMLQRNARGIIVALLGVGLITAVLTASSNNADEPNKQDTTSETTQAEGDSDDQKSDETDKSDDTKMSEDSEQNDTAVVSDIKTADDTYSAQVVAGESQTSVARRVVGMYVDDLEDGDQFAAEQRLFMETWIVDQLGRKDLIYVGDEVSVSKDQLDTAADAARKLSSQQIQLWSQYL